MIFFPVNDCGEEIAIPDKNNIFPGPYQIIVNPLELG